MTGLLASRQRSVYSGTLKTCDALNEDLRQFAYAASHDLGEPVRQIALYLQLLTIMSQGHLDVEANQYINHALQGAQRLRVLLHDLTAYIHLSETVGEPPLLDCVSTRSTSPSSSNICSATPCSIVASNRP
jgi:light-regulated signal transduction histidine kinase (bacteriophytochrome)